jgi:hypothetical protein
VRTKHGAASRARARLGSVAAAFCSCILATAGSGIASAAGLPNPCAVVPSAQIAAALGRKSAPPATLSAVNTTATCTYGSTLRLFVGYTAIVNPATPVLVAAVPGLPHGHFMTYKGSSQTAVLFYAGSAATGIYGVVRNYGKVSKSQLEKLAKLLYASAAGASGTSGAPPTAVHLVGG